MGTPDTDSSLTASFKAYERRYRHLEDIELDNRSWRLDLRHRLDNLQQQLDRLHSRVEDFVDPSPVRSPEQRKSPRPRRKKLQSSAPLDFEALKDQADALNKLADELRDPDRVQEQGGRSFENAAAQILTILRSSSLVPMIPCTKDFIKDQPDPTPQPPTACELEAYYAAVTTLRNMGERFGDLQNEQQEQWERRGVMECQGQRLDQSDAEFLQDWETTLSLAEEDFRGAQKEVFAAREACSCAGITIPAEAKANQGDQRTFDGASRMEGELPLLDGPEAQLVYLKHVEPRYESSERGRLEHRGIWDGTSILHTTPAWGQCFKKWPCKPSQLARVCLPLIAAAVPLVTATSDEILAQDPVPTMTELGRLQSPRNDQNAVREAMSTVSQSMLAISPPIILVGGVAGSAWILTREKGAFERQHFLFLMTLTASVSWWVLAATTPSGENGSNVSISTWFALAAIYTSRNFRGLRNGTWHLFVMFLGGLAITSLFALALLAAKEASMERFIQNFLIVGPSVVTMWSWLAARGQREIEGSADAIAHESIELQGSANVALQ